LTLKFVLLVTVLTAPVLLFAQKVTVNYDKPTDFGKFKTYCWTKGQSVSDPMMNLYVTGAIDHALKGKGLTEVALETADLLVTYHASADSDLNISGFYVPAHAEGVPLPGYTMWYVPSTMSTVARHIRKGTLMVEMADRPKLELIWAATAKGTVKEKRKEKLEQLDKIVGKMFDDFPPRKK
jgi:hypothetical protein